MNSVNKIFDDLPHYLPLLAVYVVGVLGFVVFWFDREIQIAIAAAVATSHVVWGIIHHKIHKDLTAGIVLEYLAVSVLGFVIVMSLIIQA